VAQTQATSLDWSPAYLTIAPHGGDGMTAMLQLVIAAVVMFMVWQLVATKVPASTPTSDASVQTTASTPEWIHDNGSQQAMSPHELQLGLMGEIARLRSISEQEPAATADVAVQTDVLSRAEATVPTAEVIEAPPLPAAAARIGFTVAFSRATLLGGKARGARWCNVRCGGYMYSTISTPIQIEEVLQRCERTATPGRDRNPREVGSSRSRFELCRFGATAVLIILLLISIAPVPRYSLLRHTFLRFLFHHASEVLIGAC
jgi:hypothetical protein